MRNGKKVLLVLSGAAALCEIIMNAKEKGYYIIVTDYLEHSPGKLLADEAWMLSIDDVDGIVEKCREAGVDGVMNYCIDPGQKPYQQICEKLGLPCVAGFEQFDIMTNKDKFKACCRDAGVDTIQEYTLPENLDKTEMKDIVFPIIIKPVDSRASKGLTICHNTAEVEPAVEYALSYSKQKRLIVERYLGNKPEVQVKYVAADGEIFMTSFSEWHSCYEDDGTRVYVDYLGYPSRYLDEYLTTTNQKVIAMLKKIGIRNGAVALGAFYDDGVFRFFDPAIRMGGAQDWRIVRAICGIDLSDLLTNFAMTGCMGEIDEIREVDMAFARKNSCQLYFDIRPGTIEKISGIERATTIPGVVGYLQSHNEGDTINAYGTTDNVAFRFFIVRDTSEELKDSIVAVQSEIEILDHSGNSMIVNPFNVEWLGD